MTHLESHLQQCDSSLVFANLDILHGFWQIQLAKSSQELVSIMTNIGVFSQTRSLQGGSDSACYFHEITREKFEGRVRKLVQWIDDYLIHDEDEENLFDCLN